MHANSRAEFGPVIDLEVVVGALKAGLQVEIGEAEPDPLALLGLDLPRAHGVVGVVVWVVG